MVDIREFYVKDGKQLPGRKGFILQKTVNVEYPLRPDFTVSMDIPTDMTKVEAQRLSQHLQSLYFN